MLQSLQAIDTQLFLFINSRHSAFFDTEMQLISGQIIWIPYFLLVIFLFFKKYQKKGFIALLFLLLTVASADFGSVHLFKNVFERLRPCHNPDLQTIIHLVNNHCGGKYGFVSSHSANFFSLAMFATLIIRNNKFTILAFTIATVVAYSRIYLGVHYPGDVIGGALFGIFVAFAFYRIFLLLLKTKTKI